MAPRYELGRKVKERSSYTGTFDSYGDKLVKAGKGKVTTLCLVDITDQHGKVVTDHLWFNNTAGFKRLGWLRKGAVVGFNARVKVYKKANGITDYKLSHLSKVQIVASHKRYA
jgi:hypothetical protein